ncbi:uncharacterized protein CIMG_12356 [Coccidioides immitis RS]|uniref:Uncharacterized protein n=1 Tax=Coccidioides immitis (strain RS) TaxID=246410 RepID=A0A0D8JWS1_COCIM|nr:uncharacterized protein CIMG_12356 [Coccidioides immitis RS]KJF61381.1 hypothetical protein CIMG_12356 [Coccidioides immitis RS]
MDFLESSSFTNAPGHKCLPTPAEAIVRLLNCRTTPRLTAVKVEHLSLIVKLGPCTSNSSRKSDRTLAPFTDNGASRKMAKKSHLHSSLSILRTCALTRKRESFISGPSTKLARGHGVRQHNLFTGTMRTTAWRSPP